MSNNSHRGGRRDGSGRKPNSGTYGEPTIVMRIPESQAGTVRDFVNALASRRRRESQDNVAEIAAFEPGHNCMQLPLYTTKVAAGFPAPADEHVDKRLNPNEYLVDDDTHTFFVRVKGDSMIDAGIFEDDVLVIDRARVAQVGDIVLAVLDGEFTVKTLGRAGHHARLIPANPRYPVIEVREDQAFEVWGVVTGSMRKFK